MRVQITGIGSNEYKDKNSGEVKRSKTLYFTILDNEPNVDGMTTGSEYIGFNSDFYPINYKVGQVLQIFKNTRKAGGKEYAYIESILDEHYKPIA